MSLEVVGWCHGRKVSWSEGVMVGWCHGRMVSRSDGVEVGWCRGRMVSRSVTGSLGSSGLERFDLADTFPWESITHPAKVTMSCSRPVNRALQV